METAGLQPASLGSVVNLGIKQLREQAGAQYTVDVGQSLFTKPLKPESIEQLAQQGGAVKLEDCELDYDIEYSTDQVPLGEILERLQNEERFESNDKSNLIRLHAANDSTNAATISATLNFATLDLSSQSSIHQHLNEINDVLFSISKPPDTVSVPLAISTAVSPPSPSPGPASSSEAAHGTLSAVPDSILCTGSPSPAGSSDTEAAARPAGLLNVISAVSPPLASAVTFTEAKTSPQECNLCNKMFGNASALAKHRLTHSDERKYLCTVCHKAFKRQDHLNGHLLTHRNKKPFECNAQGCNKSYCDARSLRRHRENHHSSKEDKLVSPASSIASSGDFDEKSLGSESCDGSIKGTKLVFTGINSLEKEKLTKMTTDTQHFQLIEQILRESKECSENSIPVKVVSPRPRPRPPVTLAPQQPGAGQAAAPRTNGHPATPKPDPDPAQNMVECSICSRKFKNIPALNGHMRLHGGYYRKDNDRNRQQQQQPQQQQQADTSKLLTVTTDPVSTHRVSSNVISLIEEKIIQKRKLEPSAATPGSPPPTKFTFLTNSASSPSPVSVSTISCSISSLCSTSSLSVAAAEPPAKRQAVEGVTVLSCVDNLVFPVLPQPDTSALLAGLQAKQPRLSAPLPAAPLQLAAHLPSVPLPETSLAPAPAPGPLTPSPSLCLSSPGPGSAISNYKDTTQVKSAHQQLLKIQESRTNFQPSIGKEFQAELPELRTRSEDDKYGVTTGDSLLWSPDLDTISEAELDAFLRLASSSAVRDSGSCVETGLAVLLQTGGNLAAATQQLLAATDSDSPETSRSRDWSAEEVDMFYEALCKHKKDFVKISGDFPNKSIKDCVEFYYLWKNICREESQSFKSIINDHSDEVDSADILAI